MSDYHGYCYHGILTKMLTFSMPTCDWLFYIHSDVPKAIEMLDKAIEVSHTDTDLLQAYCVREMARLQQQVCEDIGIDPLEVISAGQSTMATL